MDVTLSLLLALMSYVLGLIVGKNWDKYVKE